ncbi:MAG: glycosyltransferase, partial [Candidatus Woesebacteria bacterium]|nr:glycosyltransferase [Candidatus Woesebacteria bacterium]
LKIKMRKISSKNLPLFSVIITTKNEEKNIKNCLESIKYQVYPQEKIEIIVVDNHSTDKTKTIARQYTSHIFDKGPERSAQRNFGIKMSKGEFILYLDADMILSPTVIKRAVEKIEVSNIPLVAFYIPEIVLGNYYWSQVRRFERSFYDGTVIDCARFIRKELYSNLG